MNQKENIHFVDENNEHVYELEATMDPTRMANDMDNATLDQFFSRPVKIAEQEWGTGTSLIFNFNPWTLYFGNKRVINRISNYKLLRASMRLKFVINGNSFQYGRAIAYYQPYYAFDQMYTNSGLVPQDIVQASQCPHIFLNPTTSSAGELTLPFFWGNNYLSIPDSQWTSVGEMFVRSINDLKHANGATDKVTISVFAWAEDVQLSGLTSRNPGTIIPQAGEKEDDEANRVGLVSGPATTIAKIASSLKVIPAVAPFATATEMAANSTAAIAKLFGYCRPNVVKAPDFVRPIGMSSLSVTNIPDTAHKLTVDSKQELSIDPRIAGLGSTDPLDIKSIAMTESYLTTFNWVMGTAPETLLWNCRVSPVVWAEDGLANNGFHFPACAMAALPFKYWTGTMRFRFQIVCSGFHKGRLKFVYDPDYLASNEYNINYLKIVDIAEETDFTVEIGNGQEQTMLESSWPGVDSVTTIYSTTPYISPEKGNGVIGVYIVNELTTPNSATNNDIQINVYVSMSDDFEVFVPYKEKFQRFVFAPQSGEVDVDEDRPVQFSFEQLGPHKTTEDKLNLVYTGESIKSFRTILKRYNLHHAYGDSSIGQQVAYLRRAMFPFLRGNVTGATHTRVGPAAYNFCNTVLLHWVRYAFSGWRGSIRWKVVPRMLFYKLCLDVSRESSDTGTSYQDAVTASPAFTSIESAIYKTSDEFFINTGVNGDALSIHEVNPNLEFEIPFYSSARYSGARYQNLTTQPGFEKFLLTAHFSNKANTDFLALYCAAGEDFQCYFFVGLPRMYYESAMPLPA